jgi:hypothetical protein
MLLSLLACTAPKDGDDTAATPALPDPTVRYLVGSSQYYDNDGTALGPPSDELLRRTVTPASAALEEIVDERSGRDVSTYTVTGTIDPDAPGWTFSFTTEQGTIAGEGTYDAGETWAWTAWHSSSTFTDGDYVGWTVASTDVLDGDSFTARKAIADETGAPQGSTDETLTLVDEATWSTQRADWGL